MNFGQAINAMKDGMRLTRKGWNGKRQYIELATSISYKNTRGEIVNVEHKDIGNQAIAFVGTSGVQLGWLASQADMLANDWELFRDLKFGDLLSVNPEKKDAPVISVPNQNIESDTNVVSMEQVEDGVARFDAGKLNELGLGFVEIP